MRDKTFLLNKNFFFHWIYIYIYIIYILNRTCTSCAQVHELPQSHCGDNREGTLFSWLHIIYILYIYAILRGTYLRNIHKVKSIFTFLKIIHKNSVETFAIVFKVPFTNNLLQLISIKFGKIYLIILLVSLALRFSLRKSIQLFSHYRVT